MSGSIFNGPGMVAQSVERLLIGVYIMLVQKDRIDADQLKHGDDCFFFSLYFWGLKDPSPSQYTPPSLEINIITINTNEGKTVLVNTYPSEEGSVCP